jgi:hypothetical protein
MLRSYSGSGGLGGIMSFVQTYRRRRELDAELEAVIDSFETGWRQRAAFQTLESRRTDLLLPLLHAVEDSWLACREAERHYHRHAFRECLSSIGLWAFIVTVGFAPLTFFALIFFLEGRTGFVYTGLALGALLLGAWVRAPRVPPWNVQDRRARAASLAAERLLESLRETDALTERHHAAMIRVLDGCTDARSTTQNTMLAAALIRAIEELGDSRYLRRVERLARRERGIVREAAESCLPVLRARAERESSVRSLLRPCTEEPRQELLRPAESGLCAADCLVRPLERVENRAA